jgi:hypothetical protein
MTVGSLLDTVAVNHQMAASAKWRHKVAEGSVWRPWLERSVLVGRAVGHLAISEAGKTGITFVLPNLKILGLV